MSINRCLPEPSLIEFRAFFDIASLASSSAHGRDDSDDVSRFDVIFRAFVHHGLVHAPHAPF